MLSTTKKLTMSFAVTIFAVVSIFGSLVFAKPAKAQLLTGTVSDIPATMGTVMEKIVDGLKVAVVTAAVNFVSYFMKKLAYDSAVYLASGGKGQAPLLFTDKFGDYLSDAANEAGGKAIEALGKGTGLNLCQIPDIKLDLALKVGLRTGYAGGGQTAPACTFTQMRDNWKEGASKFGESPEDMFNASLTWDQSDLGIVMNTKSTIDRISAQERKSAELERLDSGDAKAVKGLISGNVKTPSEVMSEKLKGFSGEKDKDISIGQVGQLLGSGMYQVIPSTLSVFLNTLLSQGLNNLITGFPTEDSTTDSSKVYSYTAITATGGRARAEKVFSGMLTANTKELSSYNITGDFANCPDMPGINNCVVDNKLVQAVQQANYGGTPITIKEAMASDKDWLHGSWKLIPPANTTDNTDKNCHTRAYCYSNIKKLRLANILPLGFEIAAKNSNPDKPWTLKEVVDGFNDCNYASDGVTVVPDAKNKPFCHLIDPNWVLKVPPIRCNALGYTNTLLSKAGPTRMEECVDISTCVGYDNNGNCISYGYCSRTKNTWSIAGDKCDAQYNTCISYKDTSNKIVNYLYRTLDRSGCDANNVGCQVYSLQASPGLATTTTWLPYLNKTLADLKNDKPKDIASPLVYFNSNVNTKCSAKSAGCTEFWLPNAVIDDDPFYLKKAPNYLNCYDTNTSTQTIDWPKTNSDLKKLEPNTDCKNYADVCIPDEANCNWYAQADNTSNRVPGRYTPKSVTTTIDPITGSSTYKLSWNDECSSECNGYDAYQEISSNYSAGKAVDYIVPNGTGAKTCSAQEESCSSFTNLSTTEGGLEKVEYYSYLRPCIKPDTTKEKVYYTYEGVRNSTGYQLKVYTLVENKADYSVGGKVVVPKGAPKYFFKEKSDITDYKKICSEELYKSDDIYLSSDCREFNDKDGNVYYALLAKTIAVEKSCTPYRLNSTEMYQSGTNQTKCTTQSGYWNATESKCYLCFQDGVYNNGSCIYNGLPSTANNNAGNSISCSASANTCRAYKGNSANNIEKVVVSTSSISSKKDTFENSSSTVDLYNWSGASSMTAGTWKIAVSVESTKALEHSLEFNVTNNGSNKAILQKEIPVIAGEGYVIEFWAKSNQTRMIDVKFLGGNTTLGTVQLTDQWNYFKLGPKETKNSNDKKISFEFTGNGVIYIDNLEVTRVNQLIYRVKDSLTVDKDCDLNPNDNLPGQALGCTAYTSKLYTSSGSQQTITKYLTGFNYLCRENAIGCTGLIDTYNTDSPKAQLYNVRLLGSAGSKLSVTLDDTPYPCTVPLGETGCYIKNIPGYSPKELETKLGVGKAEITKSTVYIPADTAISSPVYLVVDGSERSTCNEIDKGCVSAGKQSIGVNGYNYSTVLIKNDPEDYSKALCQSEGVGCASYSSAEGNLYFKDPVVSGQKVCAWKENVSKSGTKYSGWFWKSVGTCGTSTSAGAITEDPATSKTYCIADTDCSKNTAGYTKCVNKDQQACYPDYVQTGNEYGLWSYGTANKYNNFVGECSIAQSGCTQFLDPNDKNKAYYLLNNEKIKTAKSACTGGVSLEAGCVLFNQTDLGNKLYSSLLTYASSKSKNYIQVPTISSSTLSGNDSNVVMKVVRDRECGEWLQCHTSQSVWDSKTGKYSEKCDIIGRCNQVVSSKDESEITNCGNFITGRQEFSNKIFTENNYITRKVGWNDMDFTGLTFLNMYPPEEMTQINVGDDKKPIWRLVKKVNNQSCTGAKGSICGDSQTGEGICYNKTCVKTIDGKLNYVEEQSPQAICRAYPEADSPYPNLESVMNSQVYVKANKCDEYQGKITLDSKAYACDCDYTREQFGSYLNMFWNFSDARKLGERKFGDDSDPTKSPASTSTAFAGICYNAGSKFNGNVCKENKDCRSNATTDSGICELSKKESTFVGWRGYCLEEDYSRPILGQNDKFECLTWFPVDIVKGAIDVNTHPEAGYQVSQFGQYYCADSSGNYGYYNDEYKYVFESLDKKISQGGVAGQIVAYTVDDFYKETGKKFPYYYPYQITLSPPATDGPINVQEDYFRYITKKTTNSELVGGAGLGGFVVGLMAPDNLPSWVPNKKITQGNLSRYYLSDYYKSIHKSIPELYLDDIDKVRIRISDCMKPKEEEYNTGGGKYRNSCDNDGTNSTNNIVGGDYYIRNKGIDGSEVVTLYGKHFAKANGTIGCAVVSKDTYNTIMKNDYYQNNSEVVVEDCILDKKLTDDYRVYGYEKHLDAGTGEGSGKFNDPMVAESKIVDYKNYTVMRFFFDDRGNKTISHGGGYSAESRSSIGYLNIINKTIDYGFFPQYGDSYGGWTDAVELCKNNDLTAMEAHQDSLEVILIFDKKNNNKLQDVAVAYCTSHTTSGNIANWTLKLLGADIAQAALFNIHIDAELRESCTKIVDVSKPSNSAPYTDNLWKNRPEAFKINVGTVVQPTSNYANQIFENIYKYSTLESPFTSLGLIQSPGNQGSTDKNLIYIYGPRKSQKNINIVNGGAYGCSAGLNACGGIVDSNGKLDFMRSSYLSYNGNVLLGANLFAKSNKIYVYNTTTIEYNSSKQLTGYTIGDYSEIGAYNYTENKGANQPIWYLAPKIRAVKDCYSYSTGQKCYEGLDDTISINGDTGDVILDKSNRAVLKFYAYADKNHMPITHIKVNWNDDTAMITRDAQYRNARGVIDGKCNTTDKYCYIKDSTPDTAQALAGKIVYKEDIKTNQKCTKDKDCEKIDICQSESSALSWGEIEDKTCDASYYRFTHPYSCVKGSGNWKAVCTDNATIQGKFQQGCCIFQPQVQVTDNWGWCNGVCTVKQNGTEVSAGGQGCYDGGWKIYNSVQNNCNQNKDNCINECIYGDNPWTPTSSIRVIVAPK